MLQSALTATVMSWLPPSPVKFMVGALTVSCGAGVFVFLQENKDITVIRYINILKEYFIFIFLNFLISLKSPTAVYCRGL